MIDRSKRQQLRWWWILATALGWLITPLIGLGSLLIRQPEHIFPVMPLIGFITVGITQWLVIKRYVPLMKGWALTGLVPGVALAAIAASRVWESVGGVAVIFWLGLGILAGVLLGVSQFWLLKPHSSRAHLWIGITLLAWVVGVGVGTIAGMGLIYLFYAVVKGGGLTAAIYSILIAVLIGLEIVGIVAGIITAQGLIWVLNSNHQDISEDQYPQS